MAVGLKASGVKQRKESVMRMFTRSPRSDRRNSPVSGLVRLGMALSGVVIAGLALAPAASAATAHRPAARAAISTTAYNRQASEIDRNPDAPACSIKTDGETYAQAYCAPPPGQFRIWINCWSVKRDTDYLLYGVWQYAGGGLSSYARCSSSIDIMVEYGVQTK
jgi:hypothetical protein